ncbi:unnamed protein product [Echinostoma caproni]|uniref:FLZ-type domain-containing protein n=1 Tax=Echinostoma caproni TaxID=27848 RepID=A0A183B696_9TREM|nr:unnamed protein product [Echinostoma caproni]
MNFDPRASVLDEMTTEARGKPSLQGTTCISTPPPPPQRMAKPDGSANFANYEAAPSETVGTFRGRFLYICFSCSNHSYFEAFLWS